MQAFSDEDRARDTTRSYFQVQVPRQNASTSSLRDVHVGFDKGMKVHGYILHKLRILARGWINDEHKE